MTIVKPGGYRVDAVAYRVTMAGITAPSQQIPPREPVVAAEGDSSDSGCAVVGNRPGVPLTTPTGFV